MASVMASPRPGRIFPHAYTLVGAAADTDPKEGEEEEEEEEEEMPAAKRSRVHTHSRSHVRPPPPPTRLLAPTVHKWWPAGDNCDARPVGAIRFRIDAMGGVRRIVVGEPCADATRGTGCVAVTVLGTQFGLQVHSASHRYPVAFPSKHREEQAFAAGGIVVTAKPTHQTHAKRVAKEARVAKAKAVKARRAARAKARTDRAKAKVGEGATTRARAKVAKVEADTGPELELLALTPQSPDLPTPGSPFSTDSEFMKTASVPPSATSKFATRRLFTDACDFACADDRVILEGGTDLLLDNTPCPPIGELQQLLDAF